jgi:hypothetical protein
MTSKPKKPQDHKAPKSEQLAAEANPPTGAELLKPAHELPSWDRLDVTATLMESMKMLGIDLGATPEEGEEAPEFELDTEDVESLRAIAKMQRSLLFAAKDQAKFTRFATGPDAISEVTELAMWFLGELGKSEGSAS